MRSLQASFGLLVPPECTRASTGSALLRKPRWDAWARSMTSWVVSCTWRHHDPTMSRDMCSSSTAAGRFGNRSHRQERGRDRELARQDAVAAVATYRALKCPSFEAKAMMDASRL